MRRILEPTIIIMVSLLIVFGFSQLFYYWRELNSPITPFTKEELGLYFFQNKKSQEELSYKYYNNQPIKILLVAGHTEEYPGAIYKDLREVDLNIKVTNYLYERLKDNPHFETHLFQKEAGVLHPEISSYIGEKDNIRNFKIGYQRLSKWFKGDSVDEIISSSLQSDTSEEIIDMMYAINAWANDKDVDIIINIHFNDIEGRQKDDAGYLAGFSIYTPSGYLINSEASNLLAENIKKNLLEVLEPSNNPEEKNIIIKNDSLIALGAFNTLKSLSLLVEYGYIYEEKVQDEEILKEIARLTYLGLKDFLEK